METSVDIYQNKPVLWSYLSGQEGPGRGESLRFVFTQGWLMGGHVVLSETSPGWIQGNLKQGWHGERDI